MAIRNEWFKIIILLFLLIILFALYLNYPLLNSTVLQYYAIRATNASKKPFAITKCPLTFGKYCTTKEAQLLGKRYRDLCSRIGLWTACYSDAYLLQFYFADIDMLPDRKLVFFDIGANKGYTIATWLSLWMPHLRVSPKLLGDFLKTTLNLNDCGACWDCREVGFLDSNVTRHINRTIDIHAFEPQPGTYQLLTRVKQWMNLSSLYTYQIAMSNVTDTGTLQKCHVGGEACGLNMNSAQSNKVNSVVTKITTLDKFIEDNNITGKIDLLKIDTEGFDPLVIQGAHDALSRHQIRLFIFEYHGVGMWQTTTLAQVVVDLDRQHYICYQLGKTGLFRLTGCWSSEFEVKTWSNVLCVSRMESRLISFMEKLLIKF